MDAVAGFHVPFSRTRSLCAPWTSHSNCLQTCWLSCPAASLTLSSSFVPPPATAEEVCEKDSLLDEGFSNWNRRDFSAFCRACEKYGREQLASIAAEIEGKTEEEVGKGLGAVVVCPCLVLVACMCVCLGKGCGARSHTAALASCHAVHCLLMWPCRMDGHEQQGAGQGAAVATTCSRCSPQAFLHTSLTYRPPHVCLTRCPLPGVCCQVRAYAAVFWKRVGELNDAEKIIKNIERGEQKIQRQADIMTAIAAKLDKYKNPWNELRVCGWRWGAVWCGVALELFAAG